MSKNTPDYHAYLLRVWREDGCSSWYATLQDPHTGEKINFATLEHLWDFLQQQLTQPTTEHK